MDPRRVSALVAKELKRTIREPANLFMVIVFPLLLTIAFGASFGAIGGAETRYSVAVVNRDAGAMGSAFTGALAHIEVLSIQNYTDPAAAQSDLQQGRLKAVITIPTDFTDSIQSYAQNPATPTSWHNTTLSLSIDEGSMVASAAIPPMIQQVLNAMTQTTKTGTPIKIGTPTLVEAQSISQFAYMVPGLFSYAAVFLIMMVAQALTTEREQGILRRISVTPTTVGDIFAGHIVSNLILGAVQVAFVFAASYLMGFRPLGGVAGVAVAFVAVLTLTVTSVGLGLITAAFARNGGAATGISFVFILPLMFLGTFVPAPENIARLVPTWYVTDALTSIFLRGAPVTSATIINDLLSVAGASALIIIVGILAFRRFGRD
ncbi:MAG: ABC transporter permease [Candidatus Bathyarchaeota archaeon]|nr:ABC transporter permease [Candidatus Bathyarchaeota archaeon]